MCSCSETVPSGRKSRLKDGELKTTVVGVTDLSGQYSSAFYTKYLLKISASHLTILQKYKWFEKLSRSGTNRPTFTGTAIFTLSNGVQHNSSLQTSPSLRKDLF